jgi:flagellar protein FlaG
MTNLDPSVVGPEVLPRPQIQVPPPTVRAPKVRLPEDRHPFEVPEELQREVRKAPDANSATEKALRKLNRPEAEREVERLNKVMEGLGSRLDFGLWEGTDELFVKVVDRNSNNVLKVLPPEKLLELHAKLERALGVILDEEI